MKLSELKILYVCTDFPYPPTHGALVDMWNRIQTLHALGITFDVIATVSVDPPASDRERVEKLVRRLIISRRRSGRYGVFSIKPGQTAVRSDLRKVKVADQYDAVLMQTESTAEILLNSTVKHRMSIIRVDNDESAYYLQTAKAERSWLWKLYFLLEALRIKRYVSRILPAMDMLWFVSHDELDRYKRRHAPDGNQLTAFVPSAIDLRLIDRFPLEGRQVLFVGNLWTPLNRSAVEWYIENVHPNLSDFPGYKLVIAGSTRGRGCPWIEDLIKPYAKITVHFDPEDLTPFYRSSKVFVNPMQGGAGVKLKTIEAVLRGLPVVSTGIGAEGSGMVEGVHYKGADTADGFANRVREFLEDTKTAEEYVRRSQEFIAEHYDQRKALENLLCEVSNRCRFPVGA